MKITLFCGGLNGGGAERIMCKLANFLCKSNEVTLIVMTEEEPCCQLNENIKLIYLDKNYQNANLFKKNITRYNRLKKFVKTSTTEIYVVFLPKTSIMLLHLKKYTKVPMIFSERANYISYSKIIQFFIRITFKNADGAVFQTENAQNDYKNIIKKSSIIIPNAIDYDFSSLIIREKEKVIMGIGRLNIQKNFKLLINAFSKICDKYKDYRLEIYGQGKEKDNLIQQIEMLGLANRVFLKGYTDKLMEKLKNASIFVLSSDFEGMPNALIEAMALGLPCISTDCGGGGARALIEDGKNGFLIPVQDEKVMSEKMDIILSNEKIAEDLGSEAKKIREKLSPKKIYGKWEGYIETVYRESIKIE